MLAPKPASHLGLQREGHRRSERREDSAALPEDEGRVEDRNVVEPPVQQSHRRAVLHRPAVEVKHRDGSEHRHDDHDARVVPDRRPRASRRALVLLGPVGGLIGASAPTRARFRAPRGTWRRCGGPRSHPPPQELGELLVRVRCSASSSATISLSRCLMLVDATSSPGACGSHRRRSA